MATEAPVKVVITLVHGTYGRGIFNRRPMDPQRPRWFEQGSKFQCELDRRLIAANFAPAYDEHFEWSGDNSILERDAAAKSLARRLISETQRFPEHAKLVIAHSHGGSVAMRALRHLHGTGEVVRLVTMATPFVQIFAQWPESHAVQTHRRLATSVAGMFGASSIASALWFMSAGMPWAVTAIPCLSLACIGLFVVPWLVMGRSWRAGLRSAWIDRLVDASMVLPAMLAPHRILVLRGVEDEAGLLLAFGAIGARLSHTLARLGEICLLIWKEPWLILPRRVLILDLSVWMIVPVVLTVAGLWLQGTTAAIAIIVMSVVAFLATLVVLTVLASNAFKSAHGRELLAGGFACEVTNASAPDTLHRNVAIATLPVQMEYGQKFRHKLYDHSFCPQAIAAWLERTWRGAQPRTDLLARLVTFLHEGSQKGFDEWAVEIDQQFDDIRKSWESSSEELRRYKEKFGETDEELEAQRIDAEQRYRESLRLLGNDTARRVQPLKPDAIESGKDGSGKSGTGGSEG